MCFIHSPRDLNEVVGSNQRVGDHKLDLFHRLTQIEPIMDPLDANTQTQTLKPCGYKLAGAWCTESETTETLQRSAFQDSISTQNGSRIFVKNKAKNRIPSAKSAFLLHLVLEGHEPAQ